MAETYAPPSGPPPSRSVPSGQPARQEALDHDIPDEPPPAYTASAGQVGDTTIQAGPGRMDFSGPPPMPERLEQHITGVGVGYGNRPQHTGNGWVGNHGNGGYNSVTPQPTGGSTLHPNNPFSDSNRPPPPPQHPSRTGSFAPPPGPPPGKPSPRPPPPQHAASSPGAGPSRPPPPAHQDLSPTEAPTPGRPLLRNGQMLVYPKGHHCSKCNNTGYKANDPSNPCNSDWRKYGKPYNSALAASYGTATGPNANPAVSSASNFQRPLPNHAAPQHPPHNPHAHHPPPPGAWNTYPGQNAYRPPPPIIPVGGHGAYVSQMPGVPQGALVVQPGDPRIGGMVCHSCYGSGREIGFFGFDEGRCYRCNGLGRVF